MKRLFVLLALFVLSQMTLAQDYFQTEYLKYSFEKSGNRFLLKKDTTVQLKDYLKPSNLTDFPEKVSAKKTVGSVKYISSDLVGYITRVEAIEAYFNPGIKISSFGDSLRSLSRNSRNPFYWRDALATKYTLFEGDSIKQSSFEGVYDREVLNKEIIPFFISAILIFLLIPFLQGKKVGWSTFLLAFLFSGGWIFNYFFTPPSTYCVGDYGAPYWLIFLLFPWAVLDIINGENDFFKGGKYFIIFLFVYFISFWIYLGGLNFPFYFYLVPLGSLVAWFFRKLVQKKVKPA